MNQKQNRIIQRERILKTANYLFLENSFEKTTVRQILKELDLNTGSLYNFFKNKEDILLHLTRNMFDNAANMAQRYVTEEDDGLLLILIEVAIYLYAIKISKKLVGLYVSAYRSYTISKAMVDMFINRLEKSFSKVDRDFKLDDFYLKVMALKGLIQSIFEENLYGTTPISFEPLFVLFFQFALPIFGVEQKDAGILIEKSLNITGNPEFEKEVRALFLYA